MSISYRLAKADDVTNISKVFAEAHDDLYRKRGFLDNPPTNPIPPSPIFAFLIRKTPNAFWVAEEEEKIVGFSHSFVRGSFWYFSWLFISPSFQGQGVGRNLLEKTLTSWKDTPITNRATMTFAFNPTSQFLYMKYGMYPREPAYYVETPAERVREKTIRIPELAFESTTLGGGAEILKQMDEAVLGFSMDWHHEYFFETKAKCYIFENKGEPVGYVYVTPGGRVGPMAVNSNQFTKPVLEMALKLSSDQGVEKVWYWTPGSNIHAVELAIKYRMRFDPAVFMCTKPFARWENYIYSSAALM